MHWCHVSLSKGFINPSLFWWCIISLCVARGCKPWDCYDQSLTFFEVWLSTSTPWVSFSQPYLSALRNDPDLVKRIDISHPQGGRNVETAQAALTIACLDKTGVHKDVTMWWNCSFFFPAVSNWPIRFLNRNDLNLWFRMCLVDEFNRESDLVA